MRGYRIPAPPPEIAEECARQRAELDAEILRRADAARSRLRARGWGVSAEPETRGDHRA